MIETKLALFTTSPSVPTAAAAARIAVAFPLCRTSVPFVLLLPPGFAANEKKKATRRGCVPQRSMHERTGACARVRARVCGGVVGGTVALCTREVPRRGGGVACVRLRAVRGKPEAAAGLLLVALHHRRPRGADRDVVQEAHRVQDVHAPRAATCTSVSSARTSFAGARRGRHAGELAAR